MTKNVAPERPFHSDGCSVVGPIAHFFGFHSDAIEACCRAHDRPYWEGGPLAKKFEADRDFHT